VSGQDSDVTSPHISSFDVEAAVAVFRSCSLLGMVVTIAPDCGTGCGGEIRGRPDTEGLRRVSGWQPLKAVGVRQMAKAACWRLKPGRERHEVSPRAAAAQTRVEVGLVEEQCLGIIGPSVSSRY
jgi:hypothetical protein